MRIDPRFIKKAHALCNEEETCDWDSDELHSSSCNGIARALQEARDEENRECETIASDTANSCEDGSGYYDAAAATADAIADRIAARRGPE